MSLGQGILVVVVYTLAVMRITRLINGDTILDRFRLIPARKAHTARNAMNAARRSGQHETAKHFDDVQRRWSTVLYFIECPWCVGMWVCLLTAWVPMAYWHLPLVQYIGFALAASHLIGVFAFAADTEEIEVEESNG